MRGREGGEEEGRRCWGEGEGGLVRIEGKRGS